jgi:HlyD family secretion protein
MKNLIMLATILMLISCSEGGEKGKRIQTDMVATDNITEKVEGLGKIEPELDVKISSDVGGRILEINGKPGDTVKKGDVLIKIEPKNYIATHKRAKSSLLIAKANLNKAKNELERSKKLRENSLISEAEMEIIQANYDIQVAQQDQSRASEKEAREDLAKCTITSPIDGVITVKNKELGEIAQGSGFNLDILMEVADLTKMETIVEISENEIVKIAVGQECELEVDAFPGKTFRGVVTEIANSAMQSGMGTQEEVTNYEVKISIKDAEAFRPGMNVTSFIKTKFVSNAVLVPIQAVTARTNEPLKEKRTKEGDVASTEADKNKSFKDKRDQIKNEKKLEEVVFVVKEDNTVEKRTIIKGISDDNYYRVITGLKAGEQIVIGPFSVLSTKLKDGEKVRVDNEWFDKRNKKSN